MAPHYPGAVWAVGDADGIQLSGSHGLLDPTDPEHPMRPDTTFDVASLTKILAVWASIGVLWDETAWVCTTGSPPSCRTWTATGSAR